AARYPDRVAHAGRAEPVQSGLVGGVAPFLVIVQLLAELVDGRLVVFHAGRTPALREIGGNRRRQPGLERQVVVADPLGLRAPLPRGDQDREFVEPRRDGALETKVLSHPLRTVHQLGTAQQHGVRPVWIQLAARPSSELAGRLELRFGHLALGQRLEPRRLCVCRSRRKREQAAGGNGKQLYHFPSSGNPSRATRTLLPTAYRLPPISAARS